MIKKIKTIWNLKKEYDSKLEELRQSKIMIEDLKIYKFQEVQNLHAAKNNLEFKIEGLESTIKTRELHIEDLQKQIKNLQKQIKDLKKDGYNKGYEKGKAEDRMVTLYLEGPRLQHRLINRILNSLGKETFSTDLQVSYNGSSFECELTEYDAGRVAHEIVTRCSRVLERRADLYFKFK